MLRGLTIFTGLLGVVLLGALVVMQVQRSLEDDAPTADVETEDTLEDAEIDFGESEPLGIDEPIDTPQSEPEPISTSSLDSTAPATSFGFERNLRPEIEPPPRNLGTAASSFPIARDISGAPPETPASLRRSRKDPPSSRMFEIENGPPKSFERLH